MCNYHRLFSFLQQRRGGTRTPGPAGPAGAAGAPGAPGTANVIYSPWIDTLNFLPITDNVGDTVAYYGDISVPRLLLIC